MSLIPSITFKLSISCCSVQRRASPLKIHTPSAVCPASPINQDLFFFLHSPYEFLHVFKKLPPHQTFEAIASCLCQYHHFTRWCYKNDLHREHNITRTLSFAINIRFVFFFWGTSEIKGCLH